MLDVFAEVTARIPDRPRVEVEQELDDLRRARKQGGRRRRGPK